jgi:fatty acid desaturase
MAVNYQIEHHMFPCANPYVLKILQPIVHQTAKDFNIDYLEYEHIQLSEGEYHEGPADVIRMIATKA